MPLLLGGDDNLDVSRPVELDTDAGPRRWVLCVDPGVPNLVHLGLEADVGDKDQGGEELRLVGAGVGQVLIDLGQHLLRLFGDRTGLVVSGHAGKVNRVAVLDSLAQFGREFFECIFRDKSFREFFRNLLRSTDLWGAVLNLVLPCTLCKIFVQKYKKHGLMVNVCVLFFLAPEKLMVYVMSVYIL